MSSPDEIKAGRYVLVADQWDEITSPPDKPLAYTRHFKGDKVTLDVEQARRLVLAGAARKPDELEKQVAAAAQAQAAALLAALPDEIREQMQAPATAAPDPQLDQLQAELTATKAALAKAEADAAAAKRALADARKAPPSVASS